MRSTSSARRRWCTLSRLKILGRTAVSSVVDQLADASALRLRCEGLPPRTLRNPEHARALVLITVTEEGIKPRLRHAIGEHFLADLRAPLFKGVGNALQEDKAADKVLVLGRVHRAAEFVRRFPQCVAQVRHRRHARQGCLVGLLPGWHCAPYPFICQATSALRTSVPSTSPDVARSRNSWSRSISRWADSVRASSTARSSSSRRTSAGPSSGTSCSSSRQGGRTAPAGRALDARTVSRAARTRGVNCSCSASGIRKTLAGNSTTARP